MKRIPAIAFAILVVAATSAFAAKKIDLSEARTIARAKAPKALLTSHALVREHDRPTYSFWFTEAGKSGVKVVMVDAATGKVIKVKHKSIEDAQKDRVEQMKDSRKPS